VGVIGHTGVAGLTLGGGMGRLMRKFGLTIDNLLSVDMVTADGRQLHVSEEENADLFWGLRGAGANFGVATSFEYRLHPQDATVTHGFVALPIERSREIGDVVRDFLATAPNEVFLNVAFGLATDPPFPAALDGRPVVLVGAMHSGSPRDADRVLSPLRKALDWSVDTFAPKSYLAVQSMNDEANAWGQRFYMKSGYVSELSDELIAASAEAQWDGREHDASHMAWSRRAMAAIKPFTTVGEYVNDAIESDVASVRAIYGDEKYDKLVTLKRKYDPNNFFRLNQNIRP
jgi:FAD/FMN-containing dehydrogenase